MLIILIALGYLQLLQVTVINPAIGSAEDVTRIGQAKLAAEKLAYSVNEIATASGEGRKTIRLFVPQNASVSCSSSEIEFSVSVSSGLDTAGCSGGTCAGSVPLLSGSSVHCGITPINGKNFIELEISKNESGRVSVEFA